GRGKSGPARAGLQNFGELRAGGLQGGNEAEDRARYATESSGEEEDAPIDAHVQEARSIGWQCGLQEQESDVGHEHSACAADYPKQYAFRQQLPHHAVAASTQSSANAKFFFSRGRAREDQVGHVSTSDKQNQNHRAEKHEQAVTNVGHQAGLQRKD